MIPDKKLDEWERGGISAIHKSDVLAFRRLDERCLQLISDLRRCRDLLRHAEEGLLALDDKDSWEVWKPLEQLLKEIKEYRGEE